MNQFILVKLIHISLTIPIGLVRWCAGIGLPSGFRLNLTPILNPFNLIPLFFLKNPNNSRPPIPTSSLDHRHPSKPPPTGLLLQPPSITSEHLSFPQPLFFFFFPLLFLSSSPSLFPCLPVIPHYSRELPAPSSIFFSFPPPLTITAASTPYSNQALVHLHPDNIRCQQCNSLPRYCRC